MGMSMHDRYYEPEDDDYEELDDYVEEYVADVLGKGGDLDPTDPFNFGEAVGQLGFPEELEEWEQATPEQKAAVWAYFEDIARSRAEDSYYYNR